MYKFPKRAREILKIIIDNPGITTHQIVSMLRNSTVGDARKILNGYLKHLVIGDNDDRWYFNLDFPTEVFGEELSGKIKELLLEHTIIQQEVYDGFNSQQCDTQICDGDDELRAERYVWGYQVR